MRAITQLLLIGFFLAMVGCTATQAKEAIPALLIDSSSQTVKAIQQAIESLTGMKNIKLADDVFTEKSQLIIERAQHKDSRGNLLNGRNIDPAATFSLLSENNTCYLRHNQNNKMVRLAAINCKAA